MTQNVVGNVDASFGRFDRDALHVVGTQSARLPDGVIDFRLTLDQCFSRIFGVVKSEKIQTTHQRFSQLIQLESYSLL